MTSTATGQKNQTGNDANETTTKLKMNDENLNPITGKILSKKSVTPQKRTMTKIAITALDNLENINLGNDDVVKKVSEESVHPCKGVKIKGNLLPQKQFSKTGTPSTTSEVCVFMNEHRQEMPKENMQEWKINGLVAIGNSDEMYREELQGSLEQDSVHGMEELTQVAESSSLDAKLPMFVDGEIEQMVKKQMQIVSVFSQHNKSLAELKAAQITVMNDLVRYNQKLKEENMELVDENHAIKTAARSSFSELLEYLSQYDSICDVESASLSSVNTDQYFEKEVMMLKSGITCMKREIESRDRDLDDCEHRLEEALSKVSKLEKEIQMVSADSLQTSTKLANLETQKLVKELVQPQPKTFITDTEKALHEKDKLLELLQGQLNESNEQLQTLQETNELLLKRVRSLENSMDRIQAQCEKQNRSMFECALTYSEMLSKFNNSFGEDTASGMRFTSATEIQVQADTAELLKWYFDSWNKEKAELGKVGEQLVSAQKLAEENEAKALEALQVMEKGEAMKNEYESKLQLLKSHFLELQNVLQSAGLEWIYDLIDTKVRSHRLNITKQKEWNQALAQLKNHQKLIEEKDAEILKLKNSLEESKHTNKESASEIIRIKIDLAKMRRDYSLIAEAYEKLKKEDASKSRKIAELHVMVNHGVERLMMATPRVSMKGQNSETMNNRSTILRSGREIASRYLGTGKKDM